MLRQRHGSGPGAGSGATLDAVTFTASKPMPIEIPSQGLLGS